MSSKEVLSKLPIYVTQDTLDKNPNFAKLLEDLAEHHLTSDGADEPLTKELEKSRLALETEKQRYLENLTIYTELKEIIQDNEINNRTNHQSITSLQSNSKTYQFLNHILTVAETLQSLWIIPTNSLPDETTCVLGITPSSLEEIEFNSVSFKQQVVSLQETLFPELERRLTSKAESVLNFYDPPTQDTTSSLLHYDQLQQAIASQKVQIEREQQLLQLDRVATERAFWEYYKILIKTIDLLGEILQEYKFKKQYQYDEIASKWLGMRFTTMALKLQVLKHQFLTETYTSDTVPALKKIRQHLETAHKQTLDELDLFTRKLQEYENAGMGFDKLVSEYATILKEIENKKWTLQELDKDQKLK